MYCFRSINGHRTRRCGFNSRTNPIIGSVGSLYHFKGKYYVSPYFQWHANTTDKHATGGSKVIDNRTTKTKTLKLKLKTKTNAQTRMIDPDRRTTNVDLTFNICQEK